MTRMSTFGRYREIALLGQGGMARISLATLPSALGAQKLVVIKQMLPELAHDPEFVAMFGDEARLASRLDHPNLVQTFEVGESDGRYFMVMEYLEGQPLSAVLARTKRDVPLPIQLHIFVRVLEGLHHAHELVDLAGEKLGVVHRDVTPHNVFLTYSGAIKLVDFGIAKSAAASSRTQTGMFKGKLAYASAEQIANESIDRRTDIFAVGVMLWEAIVGRRITKDLGEPAILHQRINDANPKVLDAKPDAPSALAAICERAMAYAPADRYQTAAEMKDALAAFMDAEGMRVTDADVGEFVEERFQDERSNVRRVIQERIASPRPEGLQTPLLPPAMRKASEEPRSERSAGDPTRASLALAPTRVEAGTRPHRRGRAIGVAVLFVGGAVGALALTGGRRTADTAPHADAPVASSAPALPQAASAEAPAPSDAPPAATTVDVSIVASPSAARFTLDGAALEGNPYEGHLPRDARPHVLKAAAPGFIAEERTFQLDRDVHLELALRPARPAGARPPPAANPSVEPRHRPTNAIDTADPWGGK